jgi:hypothetical protein
MARVRARIDSRRRRQRRQISQSSTTASMPSAHGTGHGTDSGPNAIPTMKSAMGGRTPSSPQRARRATVSATTVLVSTSTNAGTSSAW